MRKTEMEKVIFKNSILLLHLLCLFVFIGVPVMAVATHDGVPPEGVFVPKSLKPQLSENQKIIHKAQPAKIFIVDPNLPAIRS